MKAFLLLLILIAGNVSLAQSIKLISQFESQEHKEAELFISESGDKFFIINSIIASENGEQLDLKSLVYKQVSTYKELVIKHAVFGKEKIKLLVEVQQRKNDDYNSIYLIELSPALKTLGDPLLISKQTGDSKNWWENNIHISPGDDYVVLFSAKHYQGELEHYEIASISFDKSLNILDSTRIHLDPGVKDYKMYRNAIITSKGHVVTNVDGVLVALAENTLIPLVLDIRKQIIPAVIYEKGETEWLIAGTYEDGTEQGSATLLYDFNAESLIKEEYVPFPTDFSEKPAVVSRFKYTPKLAYSTPVGSDICFVYIGLAEILVDQGPDWDEVRNILVRRVTWDGEQVWESMQITAIPFMFDYKNLQFKTSANNLYVFSVDVKENYDDAGNYKPVEPKKHPLVHAATNAVYMKFALSNGTSQRKMIMYKDVIPAYKKEYDGVYLKFIEDKSLGEDAFIFYSFYRNSFISEITF